jgi:hypothetical protein
MSRKVEKDKEVSERERERMRKMQDTLVGKGGPPEPSASPANHAGGGRPAYDDGSVQHIGLGKHAGLGAAQMLQVRHPFLSLAARRCEVFPSDVGVTWKPR